MDCCHNNYRKPLGMSLVLCKLCSRNYVFFIHSLRQRSMKVNYWRSLVRTYYYCQLSLSLAHLSIIYSLTVTQKRISWLTDIHVQLFTWHHIFYKYERYYVKTRNRYKADVYVRGWTLGSRAFSVAGLTIWNSLSDHLRDPAVNFEQFRRDLKTYLFAGHS